MGHIVNTNMTRRRNQKLVLDYVRAHGPISSTKIAKELGVPAGTIGRVTASLSEMGFLKTAKPRKTKGVGKPPILLDLNERFALLGGVELNELSTKVVITDFRGRILSKQSTPTSKIQKNLERNISELVHSTIKKAGVTYDKLKGVGVGVSGNISPDGKSVIRSFLPHGLKITENLKKELKLPVSVANDANLAVIAEKSFGDAREHENIICLLDRGWIGTGLFLNNRLYTGSKDAAGELLAGISHNEKRSNENVTPFPFIESYGLERQIEEVGFQELSIEDFPSREAFIKEIAMRAVNGHSGAMDLMRGETMRFATALFRLSALFDPDLLVVTGDLVSAGKLAEEMIQAHFKESFSAWPDIPPPRFAFSRLNQSGVALGAVSIAMEELSNQELI